MRSTDCALVAALLCVIEIVGQPLKRPARAVDLR